MGVRFWWVRDGRRRKLRPGDVVVVKDTPWPRRIGKVGCLGLVCGIAHWCVQPGRYRVQVSRQNWASFSARELDKIDHVPWGRYGK